MAKGVGVHTRRNEPTSYNHALASQELLLLPFHSIYEEVDRTETMARQVTLQAKVSLSDMDRNELKVERGHHQHFMSLKTHIRDLDE